LVTQKTKALNVSLREKEILYKELNHRIKNNFMMILSLLKLQIKRSKNSETIASLDITKNRIGSIAKLYEMLLLNNDSIEVDTPLYLKNICNNIRMNFNTKVQIKYDIQHNLKTDNLVYVGLVVNELVTNSFKYAFDSEEGEIKIQIIKKENQIFLLLSDNGKGFQERRKNSLGLTIVEVLVEGQLQGELEIDSSHGTKVRISWNEKELYSSDD
jgi:two-component sensor histidine kinase